MGAFTLQKKQERDISAGSKTMVINRKVYPIYVDSGEKIDGDAVGTLKLKVVNEEVDIREYVNSFADECGVENVLKKFARTGDASLFAQHQVIENVDATKIPDGNAEELFNSLPDDLKKNMSYEEFVKTLTGEQLKAYIDGMVAQAIAAQNQTSTEEPKPDGGDK